MGYNARSYARHAVHKIVSYNHGPKQLLTLTLDLAMGGMKIKTHHKLRENEYLNFKLVLGDNFISPKGRVVYSKSLPGKQRASGVKLLCLSGPEPALLYRYLSNLE